MMQSVEQTGYTSWKQKAGKEKLSPWRTKARVLFIDRGLLLVMVGFLLGRAVVLSAVSPFALAFIASVWLMQRRRTLHALLAISLGAATYSIEHTLFVGLSVLLFLMLIAVFKQLKREKIVLPFVVGIATFLPRMFLYSWHNPITSYEWLLIAVESVLASVLVLIFMQSIPLLSPKRYKPALKNEEIVCMIILIASILTGTIGWVIYGAAVEQIFARYFVLVFAFVGGAAIGSTVGVVVGLILSLANVANLFQMSLLAFSGLLGGLLKKGKSLVLQQVFWSVRFYRHLW